MPPDSKLAPLIRGVISLGPLEDGGDDELALGSNEVSNLTIVPQHAMPCQRFL